MAKWAYVPTGSAAAEVQDIPVPNYIEGTKCGMLGKEPAQAYPGLRICCSFATITWCPAACCSLPMQAYMDAVCPDYKVRVRSSGQQVAVG